MMSRREQRSTRTDTLCPYPALVRSYSGLVAPDVMVAVFSTQRTIHSGAFPFEVGLRAPRMRVVSQACPHLAAAIEADEPEAVLRQLVEGYVAAMLQQTEGRVPAAAVLGCTH